MKKFIYKLLFLLFSFSLCSCNKNNVINNDLFLGEIRAQLNTVYTINCTVEPANHTGNIEWSSNWPGFVEIVESGDSYCKIKRVKPYANAVGNYVVITATIDNLVARCIVYEEKTITIDDTSFVIGAARSSSSVLTEEAVDFYLIPVVYYPVDLEVIYIDISYDDGHVLSSDDFILYEQDNYYHVLGTIDRCSFYNNLPADKSIISDDSYFTGFMVQFSIRFNSNIYSFEFDYF